MVYSVALPYKASIWCHFWHLIVGKTYGNARVSAILLLHGMQEVRGSSPLSSISTKPHLLKDLAAFFVFRFCFHCFFILSSFGTKCIPLSAKWCRDFPHPKQLEKLVKRRFSIVAKGLCFLEEGPSSKAEATGQ
jgi:hypothetical protein